jgi:nucleotidyltransferase/DNA polymerase involved in DNA repair
LPLPKAAQLEALADPKKLLRECLIRASEKVGRRLQQFERDLPERAQRVSELITDFSPLRQLPAFRELERDAGEALSSLSS